MGDLRLNASGSGFTKPYSGGSIELLDVANGPQGIQRFRAEVRFVGYRMVDTNDASGDEPYFVIGITGTNSLTTRTNIVPDVEIKADNNVVVQQVITTTAQPPFVLSVAGMDHDNGDPDEAAAKVTIALNDASAKLTLLLPLLGVNPTVGAYVSIVSQYFR